MSFRFILLNIDIYRTVLVLFKGYSVTDGITVDRIRNEEIIANPLDYSESVKLILCNFRKTALRTRLSVFLAILSLHQLGERSMIGHNRLLSHNDLTFFFPSDLSFTDSGLCQAIYLRTKHLGCCHRIFENHYISEKALQYRVFPHMKTKRIYVKHLKYSTRQSKGRPRDITGTVFKMLIALQRNTSAVRDFLLC